MCYALPVMLRGSCSCAISERPTPSPFALSSLFRMLSPIIPVHPRNAPVSPIIPAHTQKQGGRGYPWYDQSFYFGIAISSTDLRFPFFLRALCDGSAPLFFSLATRHSPPAPVIPAPWATAALRVVPVPIFTTTSRIHVGPPTILPPAD